MDNEETKEDEKKNNSQKLSTEEITSELNRRGHLVTSWEGIGGITLPTEAIATMYKIGLPDNPKAPTVFKMNFPPGCTIESHTHACDYSEIVLEGSQMIGRTWLYPGDVRIGLANRGYGPLVAGPEGATVLVLFADSQWAGIPLGKGSGNTLGTNEITDRFET